MKSSSIYFLNWNTNKCFIAEYPEKARLLDALENENFQGYFGTSPDPDDLQEFQRIGKVRIEMAVRAWFNDSRFLLHFLLATGIFLLSYYFLSYLIRDPLPLVDEIILSVILAVLGWYRLSNQEVHSEKAQLKKQDMIQFFNRIPFEKSSFLEQVELYLEKLSTMTDSEIDQMLIEGATPVFFNSFSDETSSFRIALEKYLKKGSSFGIRGFKKNNNQKHIKTDRELKILLKQLNNFVINK